MANSFNVEGVVIKGTDYGETDRIITLFTKENGKVHGLAKGVRKGKSRLRGAVQLFTHGRFSMVKGKSLDLLTQGEIIDPFLLLKEDLTKIAYASYFAELLRNSCEENKAQPQVFILTLAAFSFLEENMNPELVARFFELRLLHYLGYSPLLEQCSYCGRRIANSQFYMTPWRGGVTCASCMAKNNLSGQPLSAGSIMMMNKLMKTDLSKIGTLKPSAQSLNEMADALAAYWAYYLDGALQIRQMLMDLLGEHA